MTKKLVSLVVALLMVLSLAACSTTTTTSPESAAPAETATETAATTTEEAPATQEASALDTSKKVELISYFLGDAPTGLADVMTLVNEKLMEKFNCTLQVNHTTWADYSTKYSLILTSGQPVDMIYTANWLTDRDYAQKGAFKYLEDLLPVYAPELWTFIEQSYWDDATEQGHIYTIPNNWKEYIDLGIVYREDLRAKYDLPVPNTRENLEAYMVGIKANEPEMTAAMESNYSSLSALDYYCYSKPSHTGLMIGYSDNETFSYKDVQSYWGSDLMLEDLKYIKKCADEGCWSRNVLSQKVDDIGATFNAGQCAIISEGQNPSKWGSYVEDASKNHADWDVKYITYAGNFGKANPVQPTQNGTAFPASSQNTERAMAVVQEIMMNKELNQLFMYGIEGRHYTVGANGEYVAGPENDSFGREAINAWNWRNVNFMIFPESYLTVAEENKKYEQLTQIMPSTFAAVDDDLATEIAAVTQVENQYLLPLLAGLSNDVEADYATFVEKAKAAGLEKIQANFTEQWLAYCDAHDLK